MEIKHRLVLLMPRSRFRSSASDGHAGFTTVDGFPRSGIAAGANGRSTRASIQAEERILRFMLLKVSPIQVLIGGAFTDFDFHARSPHCPPE